MTYGRAKPLSAPTRLAPAGLRADPWNDRLKYAESSGVIFGVFLVYVVFFYLQGGYRFEWLGRIRFELLVGGALVIAAIFRSSAMPRASSNREKSGVVGWVVAVFLLAGLMTIASRAPSASWNVFVDRVLKLGMMCLFISSFVTSPSRLRWFFGAFLLAFFKMTQEGVLGYFTGSLVWENQGTPRLHGATPNYEHPNSFSGTQLSTLPFFRYLIPLAPLWLKIVLIAQAVGTIIVVVTTGSRTGYVALLLWIGYLLLQTKSKFKAIAMASLVALALIPLLPVAYVERFETTFTQKDKEGASIDMRKEIYRDAWTIFLENPLGVGVGAFSPVREKMFGRTQPAHELYLEVACDLGVQGFIVFMGFVIAMLRAAYRASRKAEQQLQQLQASPSGPAWTAEQMSRLEGHRSDLLLIKGSAQAVLSFLIIRLGLGLFGHDFYEVYWWFAAGLLIALFRLLETASQRTKYFTALSAPVS